MDMQKVAELRKKANTLPMEPGVYLMRDRRGQKAEKQGDLLLPRGGAAPAEGLPYGGNGTGF